MGSDSAHVLKRGGDGYEAARRGSLWNSFTPERYPEAIARPASATQAIDSEQLARRNGMSLSVCSGGHSWAGNHLRDGAMLIDVGGLDEADIDPPGATAVVGPGCKGTDLLASLAGHDLFFPVGHCVGVAVGGYLLQGGFGWNGRVHGPACMSVQAIDVVTAQGEMVHASAEQNADLLWAGRGSGPGFFGVVTRFHLALQRRPPVVANGIVLYRIEELEQVFGWAQEIGPRVTRNMELMLIVHRDDDGELEIAVTGSVLADDERQARD